MNDLTSEPSARPETASLPNRHVVVTAIGLMQILAWGSVYYLPAVLAKPIAQDTGWPLSWVVGALSLGLLTSGVVAPRIGNIIERQGGRVVLAAGAALFAVGLAGLALSPNLIVYVLAWIVLGFAMAAGLYDAAFSTLGRIYGGDARQAITAITLFGGLASTICWPLSAYLAETLGWRGACLVYAALHLAIACPTYLMALPREAMRHAHATAGATLSGGAAPPAHPIRFLLLSLSFALAAGIIAIVAVHLLNILQSRDIALAAAVALGTLVGPAQVAARVVEMFIGRYHHPIWTMVASTLFVAAGVGLLWTGASFVSLALIVYGSGVGIFAIARGTLPLLLFGAEGYAAIMGRLARPSLIVGAAAPTAGAMLIERAGADATLAALFVLAVVNVAVVGVLCALISRRPAT